MHQRILIRYVRLACRIGQVVGQLGDDCRVLALHAPRHASNGTGAETVGFDFMVRWHMAVTGTGVPSAMRSNASPATRSLRMRLTLPMVSIEFRGTSLQFAGNRLVFLGGR